MKISEINLDKNIIIDTPNSGSMIISDIYGLQQYISAYGNLEVKLVCEIETIRWFNIIKEN